MNRAADRDFFAEHGWLVLRGVVAPGRVAELVKALDAVIPPASYRAWGDRVVEVAGVSRASEALLGQAHDASVARQVGQLLGARRIQLLQDTALVKPRGSPAQVAWHQDYSYFTYLDRPRVVTARLALTPCTEASGCLRVLDGSHGWGLAGDNLSFRRGDVEDALEHLDAERRASVSARERLVELEPGDLSLHSCVTFHRSLENRSDAARKTLVVRLMDGDCRLLPDRLPSPELAALFVADADGRLAGPSFPVLWERDGLDAEEVPAGCHLS